MRCLHLTRAGQAGDTIVEVLIAMAVISLVLAGAYTLTNRNTRSILDAQEHGQAQKLVETQIEFLRVSLQNNSAFTMGANDCFDATGSPQDTGTHTPPNDPCSQQANGANALSGQQPTYTINVAKLPMGGPYKLSAHWDTPVDTTSAGTGNITMYYRPD